MFKTKEKIIFLLFSIILFNKLSFAESANGIFEELEQADIGCVNFMFTDILGESKTITIPSLHVEDAFKNNLLFDGSSVPGCGKISSSDMMLKPNLYTLVSSPEIQGTEKAADIICDIYENDIQPFDGCGRSILKKALAEVHDMGYEFLVGPELEFFLLIKDEDGRIIPFDDNKYCANDTNLNVIAFKRNLLSFLQSQNINIEKIHHEVAPGQLEVSIKYTNALDMADTLVRAKNTIQSFAYRSGLSATFMPKPFSNQNGSGMHVHFSLFDLENQKNAFYDETDSHNLSAIAKQFIAGILNRARSIGLLLNQTTNSYKRLVPGYEAPTKICWGAKNRSALIRIPQIKKDLSSAARAEIRCPDALANPYLLFTALIKAGISGIKNNEQIPNSVEDSVYNMSEKELKKRGITSLPKSLREAIDLFENSDIASEIFTPRILTEFLKLKNDECNESCKVVTDWELRRYL